jgi:DNA-binding transcriptional MerR regulator
MYTISLLGRLFGVSRSTLLYYDSLGLFSPSARSEAGYRLYSEDDKNRLEKIMLFRSLGVPLEKIGGYLSRPDKGVIPILLPRMLAINGQIDALKDQQKAILGMLEEDGTLKGAGPGLRLLKGLGEKAGITAGNYAGVHRVFEKASPEAHRRFLRYLGFGAADIRKLIRKIGK